MAKMIRHDYGAIHDALNKMIVAEVKAALSLLPEKCIESQHIAPLCRIVVSDGDNYAPKDFSVYKVWIEGDSLHVAGRIEDCDFDAEYTEDDDLLDITDFGYLIDQIAERVKGEHDIRMKEPGNLFYSERKIYDKVRWIAPDGVKVETVISGILAEQEPDEPTEIIYTTNLRRGNKLYTLYLTEDEILKD